MGTMYMDRFGMVLGADPLTQLPHLGNAGMGVHRKLPHLGNAGMGINRQLPHLGDAGTEESLCISARTSEMPLKLYMQQLADRLRKVRVCCGDWERICSPSVTFRHGVTSVFLDPPYEDGDLQYAAGGIGSGISNKVREWAIANGDNRLMRIALCGYEGDHEMPTNWECVAWKAKGGYASSGSAAEENSKRERVYFSPHCLNGNQRGLFEIEEES